MFYWVIDLVGHRFLCVSGIFRATEVFVKIYPFMADLNVVKLFELVRDLLLSPIILQPINDFLFSFAFSFLGFVSSLRCFFMSLFRAVSTMAFITANFTAFG